MKVTLWRQLILLLIFITIRQQMLAGVPMPGIIPVSATDSLTKTNSTSVDVFIPLQLPVQSFVNTYLDEHADLLDRIKEDNKSTFTLIQKILVKRGVPAQLMYLAVVESKLKNSATSGAGAAGVWQLMPATARTLGLKVNGSTDQRRHIYQSSEAAANYLTTLYKQFDDWLLVIAAYNCGAGNVQKAMKQSGSREFWKLQYHLPKETRDHVKRFIATHFYYEGEGSIATLTKTERKKHLDSLQLINTKQNTADEEQLPTTAEIPVRWVLMAKDEGKFEFVVRK